MQKETPSLSRFRWYFALISISGLFSVTFSIIYSYVADVTDENSRSAAYGKLPRTRQFSFYRKEN